MPGGICYVTCARAFAHEWHQLAGLQIYNFWLKLSGSSVAKHNRSLSTLHKTLEFLFSISDQTLPSEFYTKARSFFIAPPNIFIPIFPPNSIKKLSFSAEGRKRTCLDRLSRIVANIAGEEVAAVAAVNVAQPDPANNDETELDKKLHLL